MKGRQVFRHQEQPWLVPYVIPWAMLPVAILIPTMVHQSLVTTGGRVTAALGISTVGVGLLLMTWILVRRRSTVIRVLAPVTVLAVVAWLAAVILAGPTPGLMRTLLVCGPALAIAWNIRVATQQNEDEGGTELLDRLGLHRSKILSARTEGAWTRLHLQHADGESTPEDVQNRRDHFAGLLKVPLSKVRIAADPDRHDRTIVSRQDYDPLEQGIGWAGLSAPGGSIAEPLVLGGYEEGPPLRLWLPGDKAVQRQATHLLVAGMNGSGKSHGGQIAMVEIGSRCDCDLLVADPVKGMQTVKPILRAITWPALTMDRALAMVDALPRMIRARANQLGEWGYDQWTREVYEQHGMKYVVCWIEEATKVVRDSKLFIDIAQEARSAGISLVLSMQRPSSKNMTTDARAQMGAGWCFGMKDTNDAAFFLSDELLDAGADPGAWANKFPGYCYLDAPGIPEQLLSTAARTFSGNVEQLAAALLEHGIEPGVLDRWTAEAAAGAYLGQRDSDPTSPVEPPPSNGHLTGLPRIGIGVDPFPGGR